jgi:iron-sulfur cluster repair protein YtfE (RIC family)
MDRPFDRDAAQRGDSYERVFAAQHRRLDAMFESLLAGMRDGTDAGRLRTAFAEMCEALESHVAQEDRLYYPAVQALRPVHRAAIEDFTDAHDRFRAQLGEIDAILARGALAEAERAFATFVAAFGAHEAAEERLLQAIDEELESVLAAAPG